MQDLYSTDPIQDTVPRSCRLYAAPTREHELDHTDHTDHHLSEVFDRLVWIVWFGLSGWRINGVIGMVWFDWMVGGWHG